VKWKVGASMAGGGGGGMTKKTSVRNAGNAILGGRRFITLVPSKELAVTFPSRGRHNTRLETEALIGELRGGGGGLVSTARGGE